MQQEQSTAGVKPIPAFQVYNWLQGRSSIPYLVLDTRNSNSFENTRIANSVNVDVVGITSGGSKLCISEIDRCFTAAVARSKFRNRSGSVIIVIGDRPEMSDEDDFLEEDDDLSPAMELAQLLHRESNGVDVRVLQEGFGVFFSRYQFLCVGSLNPVEEKEMLSDYYPCEIIPGFLWLGGQRNAESLVQLQNLGIKYVLNCAGEMDNHWEEDGLVYKKLNIHDTQSQSIQDLFTEVFQFIETARHEKQRIFVHCAFGQSRSASMVISYVMRTQNLPMEKAIAFVKERKADINPNKGFITQLSALDKLLRKSREQAQPKSKKGLRFSLMGRTTVSSSDEPQGKSAAPSARASIAAPSTQSLAEKMADMQETNSNPLDVTITDAHVVSKGSSSFVSYTCTASGAGLRAPVVVQRRYGQFKSLHNSLKDVVDKNDLPSLPGTKWRRFLSDDHIIEKRQRLQVYLWQLIELDSLQSNPLLNQFLGVDSVDSPVSKSAEMKVHQFTASQSEVPPEIDSDSDSEDIRPASPHRIDDLAEELAVVKFKISKIKGMLQTAEGNSACTVEALVQNLRSILND